MDPYLLDTVNMLLRWAHIITGIAWIGASFYFVSLDNSLTPPKDRKDADKGVGGPLVLRRRQAVVERDEIERSANPGDAGDDVRPAQ